MVPEIIESNTQQAEAIPIFDLGDPVPLSVSIYDATGVLAAATPAPVLTIALPDATVATPTVANPSTGVYTATYVSTQSGRHTVRWVASGTNASAYTDAFDVDDAAPTGIISLADAREQLGMISNVDDEQLRFYIDAATDFIESRCGPVVRRTVTSPPTWPTQAGTIWVTPPVVSLTSVTGAYGYSGLSYDVATMYVDTTTGAVRYGAYAQPFPYPVTVTYVGGRAVVPPQLRKAALDYIQWIWEDQRGPTPPALLVGEDFAVQAPATVPYKILQALEPYALPVVV